MSLFSSINVSFGKYIASVATVADLRSYYSKSVRDGDAILVGGKTTFADKDGALYMWSTSASDADDSLNVIRPDWVTGKGRWVLIVGRGNVGPIGPVGPIGAPGRNQSDVGTFAQAKATDILAVASGITTIRLSDRNKAVFERYTGSTNLATTHAASENMWWFRDAGNNLWTAATSNRALPLAALGITEQIANISPHLLAATRYCELFNTKRIDLPAGNYKYVDQWFPGPGVSVIGPGSGQCILDRRETNNGCMFIQGSGGTFSGFTIRDTVTTTRANAALQGHGVNAYLCQNFLIDDVRIEGGGGAGFFIQGSQYGVVSRCQVIRTKADAFHTASAFGDRAATDVSFYACTAIECGDDHFPVVSYKVDGVPVRRITFDQCVSLGGDARAFVVAGGEDITYTSCTARNPALAGMAVVTDGTSGGLWGNTRITFDNCTTLNGGSANPTNTYGAMHVFALPNADANLITFRNCHVVGSRNEGLHAYGSAGGTIRGLTVEGGNIAGCYYAGIWTTGVIDQRIDNVRIQQTRGEALLINDAKGNLRINNNEWEAAGTAGTNECTITDGGLNGARQIRGNASRVGSPRGAEGAASANFIVALIDNLDTAGNTAEDGKQPKFGVNGTDKQLTKAANTAPVTDLSVQAGTAPTALSDTVSRADYNAQATKLLNLQNRVNTLLGALNASGVQKS
jgi:hypothetical protein